MNTTTQPRKSKYFNQMISEEYNPAFLNIIKRYGQFICTRQTLEGIMDDVLRYYRGRKTFREWLDKNNLQKIESNGTIKIKNKQ